MGDCISKQDVQVGAKPSASELSKKTASSKIESDAVAGRIDDSYRHYKTQPVSTSLDSDGSPLSRRSMNASISMVPPASMFSSVSGAIPVANKTRSHFRVVIYIIFMASLISTLRPFTSTLRDNFPEGWLTDAISVATDAIKHIQTYDLGNVIAAAVAVGGYLIEHWISRKASQNEKQMERVEAQSHQLLVPVTMHWHNLYMTLLTFIDRHIDSIEIKEGDKEEMDRCQNWLKTINEYPILEMPSRLNNPVSFAMIIDLMRQKLPKSGKAKISRVTSKHELPLILHNAIQHCDRKSKLWKSYEAFVRYSFVPAVQRIADIIDENGHLMEPVGSKRLTELFGTEGNGYGLKWKLLPRMWFYSTFLSYAESWQELLSMWDDGVYDEIRPSADFPVGIMAFNVEAQSIVAEAERDLIGVSQMHGHRR